MYTIKFLAPILFGACAEAFLSNNGYYCSSNKPKPSVIKHYEQGKACYVEGVFYQSCPKMEWMK